MVRVMIYELGAIELQRTLVSLKSALQQDPFLVKIEVSSLKMYIFTDFKGKNFRKSYESYILRQFLPSFPRICLTKESNFQHWRALLKGGVWNPEVAHPHTKIREETRVPVDILSTPLHVGRRWGWQYTVNQLYLAAIKSGRFPTFWVRIEFSLI